MARTLPKVTVPTSVPSIPPGFVGPSPASTKKTDDDDDDDVDDADV
jgi:hypothetical protein